jgi:glycosyltransferase involved in cell wall biosynthesis
MGSKVSRSHPEGTALVIPCFNEADRLPVDLLAKHGGLFSALLFVNDGSTDNTAAVLEALAQDLAGKIRDVHVHTLAANGGKGEAVRQGMRVARSRYPEYDIALTDADLSTPLPEMARLAAERARRDVDILQGARVGLAGRAIQRSRARHWVGRIGQTLICEALNLPIYDTQAGAKVFRGVVVDRLFAEPFISRWLFDGEMFLRARELGCRVEEEPLQEWTQVGGSSVRPWTYAAALVDLLRITLRYRRTSGRRQRR